MRKKKSKRNPGGQHGHKASRLEQVDIPDEVVVHEVVKCSCCGVDLSGLCGEILRKGQVFDIPKIELRITEHHKIQKTCPECHRTTASQLPGTLNRPPGTLPHKAVVLKERLKKYTTSLTTCLRNRMVPPTNNWSERALRSTKVKLRVSSQFRTMDGAQDFAILRSIIDSAILQGKHPFDALTNPQILLS